MKSGVVDFLSSLPLTEVQQVTRKTFDAASPVYDNAIVRLVESLSCPWSTYTARLEAFMVQTGGKVILDAGCGTAFPIGSFVPPTSIYLGMDISIEMLGHARALIGDTLNASLWNIDVERIPLPDGCVDVCLALLSFNTFPNPQKAAEELRRVIKKDGSLFGTVCTEPPPDEILSERPIEAGKMHQMLSIFDSSQWEHSMQTEGGILFFHLAAGRS